jgi:hypothetical protein
MNRLLVVGSVALASLVVMTAVNWRSNDLQRDMDRVEVLLVERQAVSDNLVELQKQAGHDTAIAEAEAELERIDAEIEQLKGRLDRFLLDTSMFEALERQPRTQELDPAP